MDHLPVAREVGLAVLERDTDRLVRREGLGEPAQRAVEQDPPVVDDDDALAQRLDVGHVVAREQNRGPETRVVVGDEHPDALLHRDVEADRRLVEEEHLRPMEQGADDLRLHALAERQLTDGLANQVADLE